LVTSKSTPTLTLTLILVKQTAMRAKSRVLSRSVASSFLIYMEVSFFRILEYTTRSLSEIDW